ncbi:MAG: hypothetical protein K0Q81_1945, partial [Paenibacillus sp.]|nr:hypothetical protein [Paenibacillus sp.]
MYTFRGSVKEDYAIISTFPQNAEELFSMGFPGGDFPLQPEALQTKAESRWKPTVVLDGNLVVGYANMYGVEEAKHGWLGNVIIAADYRGKGAASAL